MERRAGDHGGGKKKKVMVGAHGPIGDDLSLSWGIGYGTLWVRGHADEPCQNRIRRLLFFVRGGRNGLFFLPMTGRISIRGTVGPESGRFNTNHPAVWGCRPWGPTNGRGQAEGPIRELTIR